MMLKNRIDHGLIGYQVPPTPRAARSVRRRCLFKRKEHGEKMCAFEILATVAGNLLLKAKDSPPLANSSSGNDQHIVVQDSDDKDKFLEGKNCHESNFMFAELVSGDLDKNTQSTELNRVRSDTSSITGCSEKVVHNYDDCKLQLGISVPSLDVELSDVKHSSYVGSEDEGGMKMMSDFANNRNLAVSYKDCSSKLGVKEPFERKSCAFVSSVNSVKFPVFKDQISRGPVPNNLDNVKLVTTRDDDENDSEYFEPRYRNKAFDKPPQRVGDRRLKKIPVSEHCKAFADVKDGKQHSPERCSYTNHKSIMLKRQRSIKDYPIKKRKLYDCSSLSGHEEDVSNDGAFHDVPQSGSNGTVHCSAPRIVGAISNQANAPGGHASFQPGNNQVKLRIKSFRVPELHIEIPETATVGCLKRVVMEAVNSVLGGGLRVGVLLQGTKIRDDSTTLLQTGISHDNKIDSLRFCLEPNNSSSPSNMCPPDDKPHCVLHHHSPRPLTRCPPTTEITRNGFHHNHHQRNFDSLRSMNRNSFFNNLIERDHHNPAPRSSDTVAPGKASLESKAIVPIQLVKQEPALSVIPLRKCKRSESAQRRIRRPFTVAEVEALVQAVEKLGTGRWRDVKLRAFDRAKHRTYVDLKDKWKTLVHTARISPQQRRGEPVPQELLDRVLTAQAYWYHQQAKQQLKSQPDTCRLL